MPLIFYAGAALAAYLLGSIPFGYLLVRFFR
jgi:glycerol-3-phosphate acyltransferase PlsY